MVAVQTKPMTTDTPLYPAVTQEVRQELAAQRRREMAQPQMAVAPADLTRDETYLFRSRPGTRKQIIVMLPMPPHEAQYESDKQYEFALRTWGRNIAQPAFPDLERKAAIDAMSAKMDDLRDRVGDTMLRFTRVRHHIECVYGTDDPVVAAYIREQMETGKEPWNVIYEESGKTRVVVGKGVDAKAFPNTTAGWNAARAHAAAAGIADITIVKE